MSDNRVAIEIIEGGEVKKGIDIRWEQSDLDMSVDDYVDRVVKPAFMALFYAMKKNG